MRALFSRHRRAALLTAAALALASPAWGDETARARQTFQEGMTLESAGSYEAALAKFKEVAAVKPTPQVLFHVALCQEKLGRLVEALAGYRAAAKAAGGDAKLGDVKRTIDEAIQALEPRVPALTLKRGRGAASARVTVDGEKLAADRVGTAIPLDPGTHRIKASSEGYEPFSREVTLREGEKRTLTVKLKMSPDEVLEPDEPSEAAPAPPPKDEPSIAPYVIGGVGVASLAASGVFFLMRKSAADELASTCAGTICPESLQATGDRAEQMNTLGTITFATGVAALGTAAVWLIARGSGEPEPSPSEKSARAFSVRVGATPTLAGATVVGSF